MSASATAATAPSPLVPLTSSGTGSLLVALAGLLLMGGGLALKRRRCCWRWRPRPSTLDLHSFAK